MNRMLEILGLEVEQNPLSAEDRALYVEWETARQNKDFATADRLRARLADRDLA